MAEYDDEMPKIIMPFTHNTHLYGDTNGEKRLALDAIVDEINTIAEEEGCRGRRRYHWQRLRGGGGCSKLGCSHCSLVAARAARSWGGYNDVCLLNPMSGRARRL